MNPQDFCYWLQGFFELTEPRNLTEREVTIIKQHLDLVFNKVTPTIPTINAHSVNTNVERDHLNFIMCSNDSFVKPSEITLDSPVRFNQGAFFQAVGSGLPEGFSRDLQAYHGMYYQPGISC